MHTKEISIADLAPEDLELIAQALTDIAAAPTFADAMKILENARDARTERIMLEGHEIIAEIGKKRGRPLSTNFKAL